MPGSSRLTVPQPSMCGIGDRASGRLGSRHALPYLERFEALAGLCLPRGSEAICTSEGPRAVRVVPRFWPFAGALAFAAQGGYCPSGSVTVAVVDRFEQRGRIDTSEVEHTAIVPGACR